ncbi:Ku protein [Dyella sp.]|uniref:non-homologous end joining protein Ku n=1 Tax=Dyella sp. TaxID=1869338 RepID=UPI002D794ED1|nr:Ku protein [Dyella sp.]HET6433594.1 Ku protein [Dyella sp.]
MAARPIWTGTLSFGLLNVPVSLMTGERRNELHFRMLDGRNNAAVKYERVNAETGEEVPWNEIVKAFEYEKGNYVVLEPDDIKSASPTGRESVEIETFVDAASIPPQYFDKPYILTPGKKAEKGYVLLRETLRKTGKIGIARVVIRTREYLSAVMPQGNALLLVLLRYPQELVDVEDYRLPEKATADYRIAPKELEMAEQLIESMSGEWKPGDYRDEFRDRLKKIIEKRLQAKGAVMAEEDEQEPQAENASTNVVDFMALLKKSLDSNKRTPAKQDTPEVAKKSSSKAAPKKAAARKSAAKASKKSAKPAGSSGAARKRKAS